VWAPPRAPHRYFTCAPPLLPLQLKVPRARRPSPRQDPLPATARQRAAPAVGRHARRRRRATQGAPQPVHLQPGHHLRAARAARARRRARRRRRRRPRRRANGGNGGAAAGALCWRGAAAGCVGGPLRLLRGRAPLGPPHEGSVGGRGDAAPSACVARRVAALVS